MGKRDKASRETKKPKKSEHKAPSISSIVPQPPTEVVPKHRKPASEE